MQQFKTCNTWNPNFPPSWKTYLPPRTANNSRQKYPKSPKSPNVVKRYTLQKDIAPQLRHILQLVTFKYQAPLPVHQNLRIFIEQSNNLTKTTTATHRRQYLKACYTDNELLSQNSKQNWIVT